MEGKRTPGNTVYDCSPYSPKPSTQNYNKQNLKEEEGVAYYRNEYDSYSNSQNYHDLPARGNMERRPSSAAGRRLLDSSKYNQHQLENQNIEHIQANKDHYILRNPNPAQSERVSKEHLPTAQPMNPLYDSVDYEQHHTMKAPDNEDYRQYQENDNEYFTIGDYARSEYEENKSVYDELNQAVEEGDYISIIEDQYSTDDGDYEGYSYTGGNSYRPQTVNSGDATFGEPFNPAYYGAQERYEYDHEDPYEHGYYSTSNIPTVNSDKSYFLRYQQYQRGVPKNPDSNSCPALPNNINQQKRKDIFKQVSRKINETVAELRNAGIEEKAEHIKESSTNLDYIRQFNKNVRRVETMNENAFQPRMPLRVNPEKPQSFPNKNEALQRKMQQQKQQQQLQFYREMMQRKRLQEANINRQENPQIQRRYLSPQRPNQQMGEHERITSQNSGENENFSSQQMNKNQVPSNDAVHRKMLQQLHNDEKFNSSELKLPETIYGTYQHQQQDNVSRDGRKTMTQQLSDLNRKKRDTQRTESFVQLHGVSEQTVLDCCRQVYDDFKKTTSQEGIYK